MIRPWFRHAAVPWKTTATQTRASGENRVSTKPGVLQILRIAASLGDHHIPVHLARVLGSLDRANIALVTTAITRANG